MDHSWLRFADRVTISSGRGVQECVDSLRTLTAPPWSFTTTERGKPFRGRIQIDAGFLRNPLLPYTGVVNCRTLEFQLIPCSNGTQLRGQWKLMRILRIPTSIYLSLCAISELFGLLGLLIPTLSFGRSLIGPFIGFPMIYGWAWIAVLLSRKSEKRVEAAVYHAMANSQSAEVVNDLLSSGANRAAIRELRP